MAKILYAEDDPQIAAHISNFLQKQGHSVEVVHTGDDAWQCLSSYKYDLILLDWIMPGMTGLEVCKRYRKANGKAWVIFLTGQGDIADKTQGFGTGADDYLVKPFELQELSLRISSALRRGGINYQHELEFDGVKLDVIARTASTSHCVVRLTAKECALLEFLIRNPNKHFLTKELLHQVWPSDTDATEGVIRTFMRNLRKKFEELNKADFIKTSLGLGYYIGTTNKSQ